MDISPALPTFLVTLREGVEAALVVGIVLACLAKAQQDNLKKWVYGGVLAGVVGSILIDLAGQHVLTVHYAIKTGRHGMVGTSHCTEFII